MTGSREWPVWVIWAVLVLASVLGFVLAEGYASAPVAATVAILLAALKIHLVFDQYMEVRWTHQPLRPILAIWLIASTIILLIGYWAA